MISEDILKILQKVFDVRDNYVPLHQPSFSETDYHYIKKCLDTTFVSSVGKFVDEFESRLALYTGSKHAVAVINGTSALQIALKVAGIKENDEVFIPSLSFVATANAVNYLGAVPFFVDVDINDLCMNAEALEELLLTIAEPARGEFRNKITGRRLKGIIPMHTFGHPANMDSLNKVAKNFKLEIVEDAAEALGSIYKGQHAGTMGKLGIISFNGNKIVTTGGGGVILTNHSSLAKKARHLISTAKVRHRYEYIHDEIGYNYRMPNLNAALGCSQLEKLPDLLRSKRELFSLYKSLFGNINGVKIFEEPHDCKSNYWLQTIILSKASLKERNKILKKTNDAGINTRPAWNLLHTLPPYKDNPRDHLPISEKLLKSIINLPSSAGLI